MDNNFVSLVLWYWFIDGSTIYPTSFDFLVFFHIFFLQSFVLASFAAMNKFIVTQLDSQISFTPSATLKKNKMFQERAHKLVLFNFILLQLTIVNQVFILMTLVCLVE